jgi:hypothetical protein
MGYLTILSKATDGIKWAFSHPRLTLELGLLVALLFVGWRYNKKEAELADAKAQAGELAEGLKTQIRLVNGRLEILRRQKDKVKVEIVYVPQEGSVIVKDPEKPGEDVVVIIKDKGFTAKPGFGIEYAGYGLSPRLDLKLAYYKRYSLLVGGGKDGLDVSASRHLDDILFWRPANVELFLGYIFLPIGNDGRRLPVAGLRSNF